MKFELSIYELSNFLESLQKEYKMEILIKKALSGGWLTLIGEATVESPAKRNEGCHGKDVNILSIRLKDDGINGTVFKITGAKGKKFNIDISSTRFKELSPSALTLDKIKINDSECKVRIDEDIIFTIKDSAERVASFIQ